jgi:hypothetical protein
VTRNFILLFHQTADGAQRFGGGEILGYDPQTKIPGQVLSRIDCSNVFERPNYGVRERYTCGPKYYIVKSILRISRITKLCIDSEIKIALGLPAG